jgi:hypothetical protein
VFYEALNIRMNQNIYVMNSWYELSITEEERMEQALLLQILPESSMDMAWEELEKIPWQELEEIAYDELNWIAWEAMDELPGEQH